VILPVLSTYTDSRSRAQPADEVGSVVLMTVVVSANCSSPVAGSHASVGVQQGGANVLVTVPAAIVVVAVAAAQVGPAGGGRTRGCT
jgi:hypothetical protein